MKQTSIEQRFGAAMRYAETLHERGFQARLGEATKVGTSNISEIIKKDKGSLEKTRRSLFDAALSMTPALDGLTYESFLELGERILSGEDGGAVLEEIRSRPVRVRQTLHLQWGAEADIPATAPQTHRIPLLGRVPAGDPRQVTDADILGWESVGPEIPGNAYALKVSGISMQRPGDSNSISDGDTVIFVEKSDPVHNDMVVVCNEFGDVMLKRLKIKPDGEYVLASDNPAYEPIRPNGAYRIIGVVIDAHRKISIKWQAP